ncbi:DUF4870 family protein [Halomonas huangheensis]|uniref:Transmembrane protein n=1 Tax=Halomonas huangheensis TaxID=1178482 RepID=W1N7F4_9GAMM|nr:hypothetical protein [Halomonas huangheensis]ALM53177.1 hypothetical protein AR456_13460 [Halomonas huangheensis]ERL51468.1 hypothetical protein BJB45_13695 [Halomonas huangheensis]
MSTSPAADNRVPQVLYALYMLGLVSGFITTLIGLLAAYIYRRDAAPFLAEHYRFLIRTFWIGVAYSIAAAVLSFTIIGLAIPAVVLPIWLVIRCIVGWHAVHRNLPPTRPDSWLW